MDYQDPIVKQSAAVLQSLWAINKITTRLSQQNASGLGLSLQQMAVLNTLFSSPGITLKEVTEKLDSAKSTISVSVDGLVRLGLVERLPSAGDRREVQLRLTAEGIELSKKSSQNAYSYRAMVSALSSMSKEDIDTLLRIHQELQARLEQFRIESD
ncbi:MarR family winged helix-turn-helix transcriptional regulator [Paenibacillus allorhizosphaerae]|uniref:HTH marR-type domain-containing protein n=1 Tax=Paenibacillus allorhizosphaerae TaxID=2849866 RepID=A0ABM8VKS1_9BACL|nr:MarR family transcriptional regulator [Paenibacillus allorhizosphaerae]CAG7647583.1 hypothetical protein PAECIP111802_04009 [Paenibacillus allorhizosphaerae]